MHLLLLLVAPAAAVPAASGCPSIWLKLSLTPAPALPCPADAEDLDACLPAVPLCGLSPEFASDPDMRVGLGELLFDAFVEARQQLRLAADAAQELQGEGEQGAPGGATSMPPAALPWRPKARRDSGKHAAAAAASWLGGVVEAAEVQRAHLRCARLGCAGSMQLVKQPAASIPAPAFQQVNSCMCV